MEKLHIIITVIIIIICTVLIIITINKPTYTDHFYTFDDKCYLRIDGTDNYLNIVNGIPFEVSSNNKNLFNIDLTNNTLISPEDPNIIYNINNKGEIYLKETKNINGLTLTSNKYNYLKYPCNKIDLKKSYCFSNNNNLNTIVLVEMLRLYKN